MADPIPPVLSLTAVQQARRNTRFLALIEECLDTPDRDRLKPAYSAKLLELRALTTGDLYAVIVATYDL